jgi:hypothetical protein
LRDAAPVVLAFADLGAQAAVDVLDRRREVRLVLWFPPNRGGLPLSGSRGEGRGLVGDG